MVILLIHVAIFRGLIAAYYIVKKPGAAGRLLALHDTLMDLAGITFHTVPSSVFWRYGLYPHFLSHLYFDSFSESSLCQS